MWPYRLDLKKEKEREAKKTQEKDREKDEVRPTRENRTEKALTDSKH